MQKERDMEKSKMELITGVSHDLKTPLTSIDSNKFARAIVNLLMNALKYSEKPGDVCVSLKSDTHRLYIEVENSGPPLTQEQELRFFERFTKSMIPGAAKAFRPVPD